MARLQRRDVAVCAAVGAVCGGLAVQALHVVARRRRLRRGGCRDDEGEEDHAAARARVWRAIGGAG